MSLQSPNPAAVTAPPATLRDQNAMDPLGPPTENRPETSLAKSASKSPGQKEGESSGRTGSLSSSTESSTEVARTTVGE